MPVELKTARGEALLKSNATPWAVYPRPQMRRDSYLNLNGCWDYTLVSHGDLPQQYPLKIRVPFCPESQLSGIGEHPQDGHFIWYHRSFTLPEGFNKGRVLLHIGAADQTTQIYVNQQYLTEHWGGYDSFCVDITDALQENNELLIRCRDDLRNKTFPYGKQTLKRGGMWYTPVSGIWQSVWLESVPEHYIEKLHIENQGLGVRISIQPQLDGTVTVPGVGEFALSDGKAQITPEDPHLWSPEDPYLYDFSVETAEDRIESYFAIRTLDIQTIDGYPRLCLNGKPYFFHGLLDQGYWPDGLFTPAAAECYAEDILAMKKLGFNTLRKHIKVEPEEFYYQCDKLGMVVFQDMVNNGDYNFLRDTALPTIGLQKLNDRHLHRNKLTRHLFLKSMEATVNQLKNHPCICYWTIFNEGWGQFDSDNVCEKFRQLDSSRFIDATSGWFRRHNTDVDSRHIYFKPVKLTAGDKPLVLSEFGGYSYTPAGHVFNTEKTYGYGKFADQAAFADAVEKLYPEQIVPASHKGLCAAIYTQVSDVEDETNGLLSYDRKVCKLDAQTMQKIAEKVKF